MYINDKKILQMVEVLGDVFSVNGRHGDVTGLAEQSDLTAEATARQSADTTLQTNIDAKVDKVTGKGLSTNDFTTNYKLAVDSNSVARHSHPNEALLNSYTQSDANIASAVTLKHSHSNKTVLDNTTASFTSEEKTKLANMSESGVTSVVGETGAVTDTQLITAILKGANNYGDKIINKSMTRNGYIQYQSGLLIQWMRGTYGSHNDPNGIETITYPIGFSTIFTAVATWQKGDNTTREWNIYGEPTINGVSLRRGSTSDSVSGWSVVAIGYKVPS